MFRKSQDAGIAMETVIGETTNIEGTLQTGGIRIEGKIHGDIVSSGDVSISSTGVVLGIIRAKNAIIAGKLQGEIYVEERLELLAGGYLEGKATMRTLVIDEGAILNGECEMIIDKPSASLGERKQPDQVKKADPKEKAYSNNTK